MTDQLDRTAEIMGVSREELVRRLADWDEADWATEERRLAGGGGPAPAAMPASKRDMAVRWAPDPAAVTEALAGLAPYAGRDVVALIPMCLPGKARGVWLTGQEVVTAPGVFYGANHRPVEGVPSYWAARNSADYAAQDALNGASGTWGWAVVHPDGQWAVFEDGHQTAAAAGDEAKS